MKLYVMRGAPGSGKSTWAKKLRNEAIAAGQLPYVVSADDYFTNPHTGAYNFDPTKLGEAHKICMKLFLFALQDKMSPIVVDNTNINIEDIAPYVAVGEASGYEVEVVQVEPSDFVAAANRNVHGVPEKRALEMARRMKTTRLPNRWKVTVVNS